MHLEQVKNRRRVGKTRLTIRVDSSHRLIALGLQTLLRAQEFLLTDDPEDADVAIVDLCHDVFYGRSIDGDVPTLAIVPARAADLPSLLRQGYRGYLRHNDELDALHHAVWALYHGEIWAERDVLTVLAGLAPKSLPTAREREVLRLIRAGNSNLSIANALDISVSTVKAHVTALLRKYGVHSRLQLVARKESEQR